ncbi:MAG: hypothetical protein QT08_C0019G0014 [archaeon GW2011_AR17]|nr:MAG: hypothetical protein QT08_C0019G0014 [archaeon GW2011_AR17]MBS3154717.1 3'-5' exoribonuclease [Candidatus Woesearchaeota archaeon]HIH58440.1 hypothetical protein [Nanoarchaeota archaeon]HII13710.1 hypothetical protein [Nanoarchaeota archaeon]HIJ05661.1 hypothetical protein [Nanoarchaeota archaeon]
MGNPNKMIVIDVETTGVIPTKHSILSIGAIDFNNPENQFYEECRIWDGAQVMQDGEEGMLSALKINGFTKEEIRDSKKKSQKQVLEELYQWVQTCKEQTFAGENPFFDRDFIATSVKRENITWIVPYRTIDLHTVAYTYHLKKGLLPPLKEKRTAINLDYILTLVGLPEEPKPHNALTGAKMEAEAFSRLLQKKILLKEFEKYPIPEHLED